MMIFSGAIFAALFSRRNYNNDVEDIFNELVMIDSLININEDVYAKLDELQQIKLKDNCRLTIIQEDGTVLLDTKVNSQLENHLDREEVKEAIESGKGSAMRYSDSTNQRMIYGAIKGNSGLILRMSMPSDGYIDYVVVMLPGLALSICLGIIISIFVSQQLSKRLALPLEIASKQLSDLQVNQPAKLEEDFRYEELNTIAQVTNQLSNKINATVKDLKEETNKIHYLLDQMSEGIMIIDENHNVILANHIALNILKSNNNELNQSLYTYTHNTYFLDFIEGDEQTTTIEVDSHYYSINKNEITNESFKGATVILFVDITDQVINNQMKTLFFSNASHELKTPLTSIQGYTELLSNDLIKDEEIKKKIFVKMGEETKRMSRLISDILTISKLESTHEDLVLTDINSDILIEDIFNTLLPISQDYQVEMINETNQFNFKCNLEHINQILINLLSNSIKYGKPGGYVKLKIEGINNGIRLNVEDNGIGIPEKDIPHLSERFYRVDKGRSREREGTGLGLSIVKHIVSIYHGTMKIESILGSGTKITIELYTNI